MITEEEIQRKMRNFWYDVSLDIIKKLLPPDRHIDVIQDFSRANREVEKRFRNGEKQVRPKLFKED